MIKIILNLINHQTQEVKKYDAYFNEGENGEVYLHNDKNRQKYNEIADIVQYGDNTDIEVEYEGKREYAQYEADCFCIIISRDAQKRLLSAKNKHKK